MAKKGMTVYIGANISDFQRKMKRFQTTLKKTIGRDAISASKKLAAGMAVLGTAITGVGFASIKAAGQIEQQRVAFTSFLGDAERAKKLLTDLQNIASRTPFEFPDLTIATKKMLAFKFNVKDIPKILTTAGDAASGVGLGTEGIGRITLALGQMASKGKLSAQEMRQLSEAGIGAWGSLAEAIGVDIPSAMKMAENGTIDSATAINAILNGMQKDFKGQMEKQAQTLLGLFSTFKDNVGIQMRNLGTKLTEYLDLKGLLRDSIEKLQMFGQAIKTVGIKKAIMSLIPPELKAAIIGLAGAITAALIPGILAIGASIATATVPLIPFLAAGAGLATLAYSIYDNWYAVSAFFQEVWVETVGIVSKAWSNIKIIVLKGTDMVLQALTKLTKFVPKIGPKIKEAREEISNLIDQEKIKKQEQILETNQKKWKIWAEESKAHAEKVNTVNWDSIKEKVKSMGFAVDKSMFNIKIGSQGAAESLEELQSRAANSIAKLRQLAEDLSNTIEQEWISTTKSQLEQLDIRFNKQKTELERTKEVNENYQRDLLRLEETYAVKRDEILNRGTNSYSKNIDSLKDQFQSFADGFKNAITDSILTGENKINDFIESMKKKAIETGIQEFLMPKLMGFMGLPGRASGGPVLANAPYMVGERGPELFVPQTSGTIVSNQNLKTVNKSDLKIVINNNAPVEVSANRKQDSNVDIVELTISAVKKGFKQGQFDSEMGAYGVSRRPGY